MFDDYRILLLYRVMRGLIIVVLIIVITYLLTYLASESQHNRSIVNFNRCSLVVYERMIAGYWLS